MAFEAFARASAFCNPARPTSKRSRRIKPHQDLDFTLPLPYPPSTRLAQRRPLSAFSEPLVTKKNGETRPAAKEEADSRPELERSPPLQDADSRSDEADSQSELATPPPERPTHRRAGISVVPKKKAVHRARAGRMPLKKGIHIEDLVDHHVGMSLLRSRLNATRLTEMRVSKFDGRVCNLSKLTQDLEDDEFACNEQQNGLTESEVDGRGDSHAEDGLDEVPYKLVEASSERSGFLPTNVIESRSCWQSEVNHNENQFLTFELQVMPVPVIALRLSLVAKDVTPKHCQMQYSTRSEDGPWKLAWSFTVPELVAHRCTSFLSKHPDPQEMLRNEEPGVVAPWWRLLMLDNHGSPVCVALAPPLKLYSACAEYIQLRYHSRKETKKMTLEGMLDGLAEVQEDIPEAPQYHSCKLKQLSMSYGIDEDFVRKAYAAFDRRDKTRFGLWTKQDWCAWMYDVAQVTDAELPEERLEFFWRQLDQDGSGGVDFEEFLLFYNWCTDTARYNQKTLEEFICPSSHSLSLKTKRPESSGRGSNASQSQSELPEAVPRTCYAESQKKLSAALNAVRATTRMSMQSQAEVIKNQATLDKLAQHISSRRSSKESSRRSSKEIPLTPARRANVPLSP